MILTDPALGTIEKLQRILGVLPEGYQNIDLRKLYSLRDKYPKIYHKVELRLETGWEPTIQLIETGMAEGSIRPVPICLVKMMLEASLSSFSKEISRAEPSDLCGRLKRGRNYSHVRNHTEAVNTQAKKENNL